MRTRELLLFEDSDGWVGSGEFADRSCGTAEVENGQVTCSREMEIIRLPKRHEGHCHKHLRRYQLPDNQSICYRLAADQPGRHPFPRWELTPHRIRAVRRVERSEVPGCDVFVRQAQFPSGPENSANLAF